MKNRRTYLAGAVLFLGTLLLYWPALRLGFVLFDDPDYIRDNFHVNNGFSWRGVQWCFTAFYASNWHPLTWLSHMLDCQLYGLRPAGHHATSVVLHGLNAVLVFLLWQRLAKNFWPGVLVAALFAWHPAHVESVVWVSERKDVLSTLFFLLTLWCYRPWAESRRAYTASLFFFTLALLAKPMAVTLPFVLLLLDYWPKKDARPWLRLVWEKIPFFILSALSCILTVIAQNRGGTIQSLAKIPLAVRCLHVPLAYWQYLKKAVWPANLSIYYPYENQHSLALALKPLLIIVLLTAVVFYFRRTRPHWLVGWLWFLGTLVPVIGLLQVGEQAMADRYSYIPFIGLFVILAWEMVDVASTSRPKQIIAATGSIAVLGLCLGLTEKQIRYWSDGGTLFAHALAVDNNNPLGHVNYALYLSDQHQLAQARRECEIALQLSPEYGWAHLYLGHILFLQNDLVEAARHVTRAIEFDPTLKEAHFLQAQIALEQNAPVRAEAELRAELQINSQGPNVHSLLGRALAQQGKLAAAQAELETALRMVAQYPDAHYQLAAVLSAEGQTAAAIAHYREALRLQPVYPDALNNLAWIFAANARPEFRHGTEAVQLAARACDLTGFKQPMMIGTLATAYAEAGLFPEAVKTAERARDTALAQGDKELAEKNTKLLKLYRAGRAYHEPKN